MKGHYNTGPSDRGPGTQGPEENPEAICYTAVVEAEYIQAIRADNSRPYTRRCLVDLWYAHRSCYL